MLFSTISISSAVNLSEQMKNQEWIIDALNRGLKIKNENIFHICLVPKGLISDKGSIKPFQMIHWEEIVTAYKDILPDNYFLNVLQIALNKYNDLRPKSGRGFNTYGKNMERKLSGEEILKLHNDGEVFWVERNYGLHGYKIQEDKASGKWKSFKYEVNFSAIDRPNKNWFSAKEFRLFIEIKN